MFKDNMIPCAYILLTGKSEYLYKKVILELKEAALMLQLQLQPELIMLDFELAAIIAFKYAFPKLK